MSSIPSGIRFRTWCFLCAVVGITDACELRGETRLLLEFSHPVLNGDGALLDTVLAPEPADDVFHSSVHTECSSIFLPVRSDDSYGWESEDTFFDRCRFMAHQISMGCQSASLRLEASEQIPKQLWQEFMFPTQNYSVLLPPRTSLSTLDSAVLSGVLERDRATNSLLAHIIPGRYTLSDFLSLPAAGISLQAITGETLVFKSELPAQDRVSISSQDHLLAYIVFRQASSCKKDSVIIEISDLLQDEELYDTLAEYAGAAARDDEGTSNVFMGSRIYWLLIIPAFTVSLACVYVAWTCCSRQGEASGAGETSVQIRNLTVEPSESRSRSPPKQLYRVGAQRWSVKPPPPPPRQPAAAAAPPPQPATKSNTRLRVPPIVHDSSGQRLSFTVQRSHASACTDTLGLKKDTACVICYEREGDHVLLPCGHSGYCGACAHTLLYQPNRTRLCPICRARLGSVAQVDLTTEIGDRGNVLAASVGLVEPSSESVEFRQWQALVQSAMETGSATFPPEAVGVAVRARAARAAMLEMRATAAVAAAVAGPPPAAHIESAGV